MKVLLLCSSDPMFVKSIYGALRSEGFELEVVERTAMAVQYSLRKSYGAVVIDPNAIGLSAVDAAEIIRRGGTMVLIAGQEGAGRGGASPFDVMEIISTIRDMCKPAATR